MISKKHTDRVYCSRCNDGKHNEYEWKGGKTVVLVTRRCKGEIFDQVFGTKRRRANDIVICECNCQTHYIYNGHRIPIGQEPPPELLKPDVKKTKSFSPQLQKMMDSYKNTKLKNFPQPQNKELGRIGDTKDTIIQDQKKNGITHENYNVGTDAYVFRDDLGKMKKK